MLEMFKKNPNELTCGESIVYGVVFTSAITVCYVACCGVYLASEMAVTAVKKWKDKKNEIPVEEKKEDLDNEVDYDFLD